jgi:uncharacterized membrane protein
MTDDTGSPAQLMKAPQMGYNPGPTLGRVLALGSRLSVLALAAGIVIALVQGERGGRGMRVDAYLTAFRHTRGTAILGIGIAVLVVTPVIREATALRLFVRQKDRLFTIMPAIVLALVAVSVVVGSR